MTSSPIQKKNVNSNIFTVSTVITECDSVDTCIAIKRIIDAFIYYTSLDYTNINDENNLIDFFHNIYPNLMHDFNHIMINHNNQINEILNIIKTHCTQLSICNFMTCSLCQRLMTHKQNKYKSHTNNNWQYIFWEELLNKIRYYLIKSISSNITFSPTKQNRKQLLISGFINEFLAYNHIKMGVGYIPNVLIKKCHDFCGVIIGTFCIDDQIDCKIKKQGDFGDNIEYIYIENIKDFYNDLYEWKLVTIKKYIVSQNRSQSDILCVMDPASPFLDNQEKWIEVNTDTFCYCSEECKYYNHEIAEPNNQSKYSKKGGALQDNLDLVDHWKEREALENAFDEYIDPDENGGVDEIQWLFYLQKLNVQLNEAQQKRIYNLIDEDDCGIIVKHDFVMFGTMRYDNDELIDLQRSILQALNIQ